MYPQTVAIREWAQFHQMLKGMQHHSTTTSAHRETTQINGVREYIYGDRFPVFTGMQRRRQVLGNPKNSSGNPCRKRLFYWIGTARAYRDAAEFELAVSVAASLFRYGAGRELSLGLLSIGKESTYFEPKQSQHHHKQIIKAFGWC